jgi:phage tail-like protein
MQQPTYLDYLPEIFRTHDRSGFLAAYLRIFSTILSERELIAPRDDSWRLSMEQVIDTLPGLFHPRLSSLFLSDNTDFLPALDNPSKDPQAAAAWQRLTLCLGSTNTPDWLNHYLDWYGEIFAMTVHDNWDVDAKRRLLARTMALYRKRGTADGLTELLSILVTAMEGPPPPSTAAITATTATANSADVGAAINAGFQDDNNTHAQSLLSQLVTRAVEQANGPIDNDDELALHRLYEDRIRQLAKRVYQYEDESYANLIAVLQEKMTTVVTSSMTLVGNHGGDLPTVVSPPLNAVASTTNDVPAVVIVDHARLNDGVMTLNKSTLDHQANDGRLDGYLPGHVNITVTIHHRDFAFMRRARRLLTTTITNDMPLGTRFNLALRPPTMVIGKTTMGVDSTLGDRRVLPFTTGNTVS